jgi:uncharacterized protein (TIGR02284 family)
MARMIRDVIALLNRLIQLDYDSIEAYKAAIARLGDADDRKQLSVFLGDHRRHVDELAFVGRNLGGEPASHGDLRQVLTKGKVVLGALTGDRAMLEAMRGNEAETSSLYEKAASQPGIPVDVLAVLERNLSDERRHEEWLGARLTAMHPAHQRGT